MRFVSCPLSGAGFTRARVALGPVPLVGGTDDDEDSFEATEALLPPVEVAGREAPEE